MASSIFSRFLVDMDTWRIHDFFNRGGGSADGQNLTTKFSGCTYTYVNQHTGIILKLYIGKNAKGIDRGAGSLEATVLAFP